MTKEEKEKLIQELSDIETCQSWESTAINKAIKALEEQPCIDCVSRKLLFHIVHIMQLPRKYEEPLWNSISQMPSVQPKSPWIRIEFKGDALNCLLPDDGERVFLRFKNGYVTTDTCEITYDEEDNRCYSFEDNPDFEDIDAWMKIPE